MPTEPALKPRRRWQRIAAIIVAITLTYFAIAYLVIPFGWKRYVSRHPELEDIPRVAYTASGLPADPLNVELIGPENGLKRIMVNAHWYPADALTLRSCLEIAEASVLKRPYDAAPVSDEFLFGRKQDLAFEKPVGDNPRERHHVRFWRAPTADSEGRTVWIGSAIFDKRVGLESDHGSVHASHGSRRRCRARLLVSESGGDGRTILGRSSGRLPQNPRGQERRRSALAYGRAVVYRRHRPQNSIRHCQTPVSSTQAFLRHVKNRPISAAVTGTGIQRFRQVFPCTRLPYVL